jgi:cobalt-zinc-cadmium efflux system protein
MTTRTDYLAVQHEHAGHPAGHGHGDGGHDHNHTAPGHGHSDGHTHSHGGHSHGGHHHRGDNASERRLWISLLVLGGFTIVEGIGGFWAHSIALLAEAAHMLADCGSLLLAIFAIRISRRPPSASRTYGHRRYQPLAAYTNGLLLLAITAVVIVEAAQRLLAPPAVNGHLMLVIAIAGAVANLAAFLILSGASSLNEKGARAHVLSDLLGSAAAVGAAVVILVLGWLAADPLLSLLVSILIIRSAWSLTTDSAHILLEGSPTGFDTHAVERELAALPEVKGIHHVHAWSLTGEAVMVTLHAQINEGADGDAALTEVTEALYRRFGVDHATVQIEEGVCPSPSGSTECRGTC